MQVAAPTAADRRGFHDAPGDGAIGPAVPLPCLLVGRTAAARGQEIAAGLEAESHRRHWRSRSRSRWRSVMATDRSNPCRRRYSEQARQRCLELTGRMAHTQHISTTMPILRTRKSRVQKTRLFKLNRLWHIPGHSVKHHPDASSRDHGKRRPATRPARRCCAFFARPTSPESAGWAMDRSSRSSVTGARLSILDAASLSRA